MRLYHRKKHNIYSVTYPVIKSTWDFSILKKEKADALECYVNFFCCILSLITLSLAVVF